MQLYVKRDRFNTFEKARIEINKVEDFTVIIMALKERKERMEKLGWDKDEEQSVRKLYEDVVSALNDLDILKAKQM